MKKIIGILATSNYMETDDTFKDTLNVRGDVPSLAEIETYESEPSDETEYDL